MGSKTRKKINQKNVIPNTANHIIKDNSNPEKVIELHLLKEPKTVNSFIVKVSHIEYYRKGFY